MSFKRLVSSIQTRELLYKTAFIRRSKNLQKAETKVDLLGDQVDALIGLLEKIYTTLHQRSPVLQQHFESKNLAPEYEAATTELKGKAVLAKVNAINEIELAKRWGIQGYTTIYFFVNGVHMDTYYHNRKKDDIVNYIKTKMAGDLYTVMTTENAEHLLTAQSTIGLGFLNSLKGLKGEALAAASKLHPDVLFFQTTRVDVANMFLIDPEIKCPALVLLEKESKQLSHFGSS
ncbi:hypothetical protein WN943_018611 [Citrus x changshan-huyou]